MTDDATRAALDAATAALGTTPAERAAVRRYQALEEASLNAFLRGEPLSPATARHAISVIRLLDRLAERASLPCDLVLYRGVPEVGLLPAREAYPVAWAPASFVSTSLSRDVAAEIAGPDGVVLRLLAQRRQPGLWLPPLGYRRLVYEQEVLFPTRSFLLLLAWGVVDGRIEIHGEVM